MAERAVLVHYHEIGLKGRNRGAFERRLRDNLRVAVAGLTDGGAHRIASRVVVPVTDPARVEELLAVISQTPGVSNLGYAYVTGRDSAEIASAALDSATEEIARLGGASTFAIEARRSSTDYPESSMEMNVRLGDDVRLGTGLSVDLSSPDIIVRVEVVQAEAYVFARRIEGPGGLPVGTSGRVVALLSSGIDSPVACWHMMRRGAVVIGVHFSGRPQTDDASERNVAQLAEALGAWGGMARLYVVPFGDLQREIALKSPPDLRILLYRRLMVRVAEALAEVEGAKALVTGESLGQVASQTLENIAAVDAAAALPVLRPLIGLDKQEIIARARAIGTYELSILPAEDCCTLFMPRTPETHATVAEVEAGEADLDIGRMVADAVASATSCDLECPACRKPREPSRPAE